MEETIEKWNSRTKLISNLSQNTGKKSTSVFNATIVEQVNSLLANEESRNRLIEKSQAKRDTYRILGRGVEDLHKTSDANIYNDHDFYQVLLSDFLQASGEQEDDAVAEGAGAHDAETEKRFLGGADLGLTQKYLEKKQKMAEQARKAKKDIDRRASKNRKIRYVVHDKILNFLVPVDNLQVVEGRDALVGNLFGAKKMADLAAEQMATKKDRKRRRKSKETFGDDDGESDADIKLI